MLIAGAVGAVVCGLLASVCWSYLKERYEQDQLFFDKLKRNQNLVTKATVRGTAKCKNVDELLCIVCCAKAANVLLVPCNHLSMCGDCTSKVAKDFFPKCPICRSTFDAKKIVTIEAE